MAQKKKSHKQSFEEMMAAKQKSEETTQVNTPAETEDTDTVKEPSEATSENHEVSEGQVPAEGSEKTSDKQSDEETTSGQSSDEKTKPQATTEPKSTAEPKKAHKDEPVKTEKTGDTIVLDRIFFDLPATWVSILRNMIKLVDNPKESQWFLDQYKKHVETMLAGNRKKLLSPDKFFLALVESGKIKTEVE